MNIEHHHRLKAANLITAGEAIAVACGERGAKPLPERQNIFCIELSRGVAIGLDVSKAFSHWWCGFGAIPERDKYVQPNAMRWVNEYQKNQFLNKKYYIK